MSIHTPEVAQPDIPAPPKAPVGVQELDLGITAVTALEKCPGPEALTDPTPILLSQDWGLIYRS